MVLFGLPLQMLDHIHDPSTKCGLVGDAVNVHVDVSLRVRRRIRFVVGDEARLHEAAYYQQIAKVKATVAAHDVSRTLVKASAERQRIRNRGSSSGVRAAPWGSRPEVAPRNNLKGLRTNLPNVPPSVWRERVHAESVKLLVHVDQQAALACTLARLPRRCLATVPLVAVVIVLRSSSDLLHTHCPQSHPSCEGILRAPFSGCSCRRSSITVGGRHHHRIRNGRLHVPFDNCRRHGLFWLLVPNVAPCPPGLLCRHDDAWSMLCR
jgi:hypothetical protein